MKEPPRFRLPSPRPAIVHRIDVDGREFYVTVGFYDDPGLQANPAEIFIVTANMQAKAVNAVLQSWAVSLSMHLQYGVPWKKLHEKFSGADVLTASLIAAVELCCRERRSIVGLD